MSKLLLVPLDDLVVFPAMDVTLTVDTGGEERVLLVPRHEGAYAKVGTVAEVGERIRLPGGGRAVALSGLHRAVIGAAETDSSGRLRVEVEERPDEPPPPSKTRELEREYRAVVEEILELRGDDGRVSAFVRAIAEPGALADTSGYAPDLTFEQKVELLETVDVIERLELALCGCSASGSPSCRCASASATTWRTMPSASSASTCCASRSSRSARSSGRTTRRSPRSTGRRSTRPACPTPSASRPSASSAGWSGWATRAARPR